MTIPDGWTDVTTILLGSGTVSELVDVIINAALSGEDPAQTCAAIQTRFQISPDDAALALDRAYGGIVRAKAKSPLNRPDPEKDPIAFESYERTRSDATIIQRLGA